MNPRFATVEPSLIREVNARKKPGDVDLGLGEPVLRPDMAPMERALQWVAENGCPYTANAGDMGLRKAVGAYLGTEAAQVVITHGSQEALYVGLRVAVNPACDEVLIVEPAYPAYAKICEVEQIRWRSVPLSPDERFAPRAAAVLEALRDDTRLVVLSSPCNPTGRTWPREELQLLAAGLPAGCRVLSDEVYRELWYHEPPTSMASLYENTLVCGGLSKSHALTGLRLGWLACPPDLTAPATRAHQLMTTAASTFAQQVALEVFNDLDSHLTATSPRTPATSSALGVPHRAIYAERHAALQAALRETGLSAVVPDGAFYCLVEIPGRAPSLPTALRLLEEQHVVTIPGIAFGQTCEGWLRISWVADAATVAEGLRRVADGLQPGGRAPHSG